jgi:hypothetical protein
MGTNMTSIPTPAPACQNCEDAYPGFCRRCAYLMNNMRRWRRVAEQLHAGTCTHPARQVPTSCSTLIESIYNEIDDTEMGLL